MLLRFLETLLVSLTGGLFFRLLHLPLPWLLGSLAAVMIWSLTARRNVFWPVGLRNSGLVILGYMLGSSFAIETGLQIIKQLPAMMFATASTILFSLFIGYIIHRRTDISLSTCIIGSVPGGLTQMVVLSEEIADTDLTVVTFMQTIRLLSTVFIVPFLIICGLAGDTQQAVAANIPDVQQCHPYTLDHIFVYRCCSLCRVGSTANKLTHSFPSWSAHWNSRPGSRRFSGGESIFIPCLYLAAMYRDIFGVSHQARQS